MVELLWGPARRRTQQAEAPSPLPCLSSAQPPTQGYVWPGEGVLIEIPLAGVLRMRGCTRAAQGPLCRGRVGREPLLRWGHHWGKSVRWKLAVGRLWALGVTFRTLLPGLGLLLPSPTGFRDSPEALVPEQDASSEPLRAPQSLFPPPPTCRGWPCVRASLRLALPLPVPRDKCCLMIGIRDGGDEGRSCRLKYVCKLVFDSHYN